MKILVKSIYNQGYIYVSASVSSSILTSLPALFPEDEKSKKNAVRWINFFICSATATSTAPLPQPTATAAAKRAAPPQQQQKQQKQQNNKWRLRQKQILMIEKEIKDFFSDFLPKRLNLKNELSLQQKKIQMTFMETCLG